MSPWLIILWAILYTLQPSACQKSRTVESNSRVCNTPACCEVAAQFTVSMKTTIDPCVNFYQYVCGRWPSANPKPKYHNTDWNNMARLTLLAQTRLRDELQSAASSSDSQPIRQMKKFYETCMDERSAESDAVTRIQRILYESGGWPMIMTFNQLSGNCRTWQAVDEYYSNILGNSTFYTIDLTGGYWSDYYAILIEYPLFYHDLYNNRETYRSLIKSVAEVLIRQNDAIVSNQQLENDIDDLIRLEDHLYQASRTSDDWEDIENVSIFVRKWNTMSRDFPGTKIDWQKVFQRIFVITNVRPSANAPVIVKSLEYFLALARILQSTTKRTIVNFIQWKFLSKILPQATKKMEDLFYKIENDVQDVTNKPPRWVHCVNQIGRNYASYSLFIKKYYQQNSRQAADNLHQGLLNSWKKQLDNSNWLSRKAKNSAKQKLETLSAVLGYSTFYKNDQEINDYFEGLMIGDSYFVNTLNFVDHGWRAQMRNWGKPEGSTEWLSDPLHLRAVYFQGINTLYLTPVLLQSPLFDGTLPNYVTYGSVAFIIAHEMSHALDYKEFTKMLTASELTTYNEVIQCFIHIYDAYFRMAETIHDPFIKYPASRGVFTLNENIADWSGLQTAFQAYKRMKKDKIPNGEFKLPGFEKYTDDKMFFIAYAQTWCNENLEDDWNDVHSPGYLRAIATVSNTAAFAATFNCSRNTPMNSEKKCNIWTK